MAIDDNELPPSVEKFLEASGLVDAKPSFPEPHASAIRAAEYRGEILADRLTHNSDGTPFLNPTEIAHVFESIRKRLGLGGSVIMGDPYISAAGDPFGNNIREWVLEVMQHAASKIIRGENVVSAAEPQVQQFTFDQNGERKTFLYQQKNPSQGGVAGFIKRRGSYSNVHKPPLETAQPSYMQRYLWQAEEMSPSVEELPKVCPNFYPAADYQGEYLVERLRESPWGETLAQDRIRKILPIIKQAFTVDHLIAPTDPAEPAVRQQPKFFGVVNAWVNRTINSAERFNETGISVRKK